MSQNNITSTVYKESPESTKRDDFFFFFGGGGGASQNDFWVSTS